MQLLALRGLSLIMRKLLTDPTNHEFLRQETPSIVARAFSIINNPQYSFIVRDEIVHSLTLTLFILVDGSPLRPDVG